MSVPCPKCKNEVYRPYTKCSACGWEATGKWKDKARKLVEKEDADKEKQADEIRKRREKRLAEKRKERGEPPIAAESSKKKKYPDIDVDAIEDDEFEDIFGPMDDDDDDFDDDYVPIVIPCKCGGEILVETPLRPTRVKCPSCGKGGTLKKDPPNARKVKPGSRSKPSKPAKKGKNACPVCGVKNKGGRFCHSCGASLKQSARAASGVKKPTQGICSECGNKRLDFFDDGTGNCPKCGHSFRWDLHVANKSEPPPPPPPKNKCSKCGAPLKYVKQYKRYYCHSCKKYD